MRPPSSSVRDGHHHLTVNKVDGPQTFRVTSDPGHLGALHTTAVGKALVAFAEDARARARCWRSWSWNPSPSVSITDRDAFRAEIDQVRRQGYAVMDEENETRHARRGRAAPQLPGPSPSPRWPRQFPVFRLSLEASWPMCPLLQEAAAELAARLPQR